MIKRLIERRINSFVERVLSERKDEITQRIDKETKVFEAKKQTELERLVTEKESLINKITDEKAKLSETLSIVNQNLTAQDIWLKLWTVAFDKAMDVCWDLTKENTKKMIDTVKDRTWQEAREDTQKIIETHNKNVEKELENMDVNKMSILNAKKEAHEKYLIYNRSGDKKREEYFKGQLDLLERVLNGKKD